MNKVRDALQGALVEREDEVTAVLLGLIAREHVLLVGPPGTGKSYLCRTAAGAIGGARYCERLLSPTTPPEAIFGPISLSALREDRYMHAGAGYAADAEILYLDEVGRASPAILDALLHLLGPERQALIGTEQVKAPLVCAVGSANTWPEDAAMLDRWLIRRVVRPVSPGGLDVLLWSAFPPVAPVVGLGDLEAAHAASLALPVTEEAKNTLGQILGELAAEGIRPSDRRCRAAVRVARAAAVLEGASEVRPAHLECLAMVLWDRPEQAEKATEVVTRAANPTGARVMELLRECDEAVTAAVDQPTRLAASVKLEEILGQAQGVAVQAGANGRASKAVAYIRRERVRIQAMILGIPFEKAAALLGAE